MRFFPRLRFGLLALLLLTAACQGGLLTPPREANPDTQTAVFPTPLPPIVIPAPTPTAGGIAAAAPDEFTALTAPTLTVWVNEDSPSHETALRAMAAAFQQQSGVAVELRLVTPSLLPKLVETAVQSSTLNLPDVVIHPLDYTLNWAARGILDTSAAAAVLTALDPETFDPNALALVGSNGATAALPSDGAPQLIIYRQDWFVSRNLSAPNNFDAMFAAAETLYNRENFIAGFVVPTESNLVSTHRIFEHMALANGCQLIEETGRVTLLEPVCQNALNFYYDIIHNYSPIGVQTNTSTRDAYLSGRAGLIMGGPGLLPQIAGLDAKNSPTCPECESDANFLRTNTQVLTTLTGRGNLASPVSFSEMTVLGITTAAESETAVSFAQFWFNEGYETWLGVEPERKIPLRRGSTAEPTRYIDGWGATPLMEGSPSLLELFGPELVSDLKTAVSSSTRWGFPQNQGSLLGELYKNLTFSIVLQEMLSGYFNTEKTLAEAYNRVVDLIPNYSFSEGESP